MVQNEKSSGLSPPPYIAVDGKESEEGAAAVKTTSSSQKPVESAATKSVTRIVLSPTDDTQSELSWRTYSYPQLNEILASNINTVRLLRSILVFVMFATFDASRNRISNEIYNRHILFPLQSTLHPRMDNEMCLKGNVPGAARELCALVWYLERKMSGNRWFHVRREHQDLLIQLVLKPAEKLEIQADYALDILGTFRQYFSEVGGPDGCYTLADNRTPRDHGKFSKKDSHAMMDLGNTLGSHVSFITLLKLPKELNSELEFALSKYAEERNLKEVQGSDTLKR